MGHHPNKGGDVYFLYANTANAYNNIIYGNTAMDGEDIYFDSVTNRIGYNNDYLDMDGTWTESGSNLDTNPLLVDTANNDFHLQPTSPMIDNGTTAVPVPPGLPDTDFEGDTRPSGIATDIGADEYLTRGIFDTEAPANPYPSIIGTHNGTITPNQTITVSNLYTYPCTGTGGHTEYVRFENKSWNVTANWNGYQGDWHNISFNDTFVLYKNETYNYNICTGSYPQIIHNQTLTNEYGTITCTDFTDANGNVYYDWIPAIRLE